MARYGRSIVRAIRPIAPDRDLPLTWDEWSNTNSFTVSSGGSTLTRTVSDTIALVSDTVSRVLTLARTLADTVTSSETVARILTLPRTLADTVSSSETVSRLITLPRVIADTISSSEAVESLLVTLRTATDTVTSSDAVERILSVVRAFTDTTALNDAVTRAYSPVRSLTDTLSPTDALGRLITYGRSLSETLTSSDAANRVASIIRSFTDTTSLTEAVTKVRMQFRTAADRIGIYSLTGRLGAYRLGRRENALGRDTTDAVAADVVAKSQSFLRTPTDTLAAISDSVRRIFTGARTLADTISVTTLAIVGRIFSMVRIRDESVSTVSTSLSQPPIVSMSENEPASVTLADYQE